MFSKLLLHCVYRLDGERSASAIYHLLTGKRSAQTLQDAHIYRLTRFFGVYKTLNRHMFDKSMNQLCDNQWIEIDSNSMARITQGGIDFLERKRTNIQIHAFDGMKYDRLTDIFSARLLLFIQTITNKESGQSSFIAITDNRSVQSWVKNLYRNNKNNIRDWLNGLYMELRSFLTSISNFEASLFVDRITGYQRIGYSKEQLAEKYQLSYSGVELIIVLITHKLLHYLTINKSTVPYLYTFIEDLIESSSITDSAGETYHLLKKGYNITQIARVRNLKVSTIQDHLVELAYVHSDFRFNAFISSEEIKEILSMTKQLKTRKLKVLKSNLHDKYSYFQIRLALALQQGED